MLKAANVGMIDRMIRVVCGAALLAAPHVWTSDLWANPVAYWGATVVGVVLVVTAAVRFCPLYRLIGVRTCSPCQAN